MGKFRGEVDEQWFDSASDNFTIVNEGHFHVELVEIAVETVGTRVFVTETRGDLEVFRNATNHQKLLELLRGLREGVKLTRMEARRNEKVAGAFRAGVCENRRGDFGEIVVVHVISDKTIELGATFQDVLHGWATEVEVTVF